jgi:hypothetical protein
MALVDLFSKREKKKKLGQEDVFQYDHLPEPFRVQVIHLWHDALGDWRDRETHFGPLPSHLPSELWVKLYKVYTREKGVFRLVAADINPSAQFRAFFMQANTEDALDVIELVFRMVGGYVASMEAYERQHWGFAHPDRVIEELNARFREHGIGYEFAGGDIVRVDSKYLHAEAVRPALELLHGAGKGLPVRYKSS